MEPVAFFDIGDTLGAVRVNAGGTELEITPFPGCPEALATLRDHGVRLGIISHRGSIPGPVVEAALDRADLLDFFDPGLVVYGRKDSVRIFDDAAALVPGAPVVAFIGEDAGERAMARLAGFRVCPHPVLAPRVLLGQGTALRYVRIRTPGRTPDMETALRDVPVVVLHRSATTDPSTLYAVTDDATALELDDRGLWVDRLGDAGAPDLSELYLLRTDGAGDGQDLQTPMGVTGALRGEQSAGTVLASTSDGLYVAVPAGRSVDALHLGAARHGHTLKLTAVAQPPGAARERAAAVLTDEADLAGATLTDAERSRVREVVTASRIAREVARYSGTRPLMPGVQLTSRHIAHADNPMAVQALMTDLAELGLTVRTVPFSHGGRTLDNVEAVLPGHGLDGTVVLSAHLDSTAARAPGFRPAVDPAPGADDDASGVAAVLVAAKAVLALDAAHAGPRRELRFVLFNAEEQGLVGSRAYVRGEATRGADVVAAFQLDMVGFDAAPGRAFELHAGFSADPVVQQSSLALAQLVTATAGQVVPALPAPQVYPAAGGPDPAEQRSDHYSFQLYGYPACLASEDFFAGPLPGSPPADANPDYHLPSDTAVTSAYARDITRAVTAAAWICGTR